jgi:hypothetical protein
VYLWILVFFGVRWLDTALVLSFWAAHDHANKKEKKERKKERKKEKKERKKERKRCQATALQRTPIATRR